MTPSWQKHSQWVILLSNIFVHTKLSGCWFQTEMGDRFYGCRGVSLKWLAIWTSNYKQAFCTGKNFSKSIAQPSNTCAKVTAYTIILILFWIQDHIIRMKMIIAPITVWLYERCGTDCYWKIISDAMGEHEESLSRLYKWTTTCFIHHEYQQQLSFSCIISRHPTFS